MLVSNKLRACVLIIITYSLALSGCSISGSQSSNNGVIRFEHLALNVQNPIVVADWYCHNLDMKIQRAGEPPSNTRFVSDKDGNMMFEFYHNADAVLPDYFKVTPGSMHIAFAVEDVDSLFKRLQLSGATVEQLPQETSTGDTIGMLRDPWGVPIQILKRKHAMLENK